MYRIDETSLEWALKHLINYSDSDFFPKLFEFKAISHNWSAVKKHILNINLEEYTPQNPVTLMAPKLNGTFRAVHQLEPIDALIYTALLHEVSMSIEQFRAPENSHIACSYRISSDIHGSFFKKKDDGWKEFIKQSEKLSEEFADFPEDGFVLTTDIADFYNQIYIHRVNNIISEVGCSQAAKIIEKFLMGLNSNVSIGIPVGPSASIVVAEAILADIDRKVLSHTGNYTRYVDDMNIFFKTRNEAVFFLYDFTKFLYDSHRLILSGEKTRILPVSIFKAYYLNREALVEKEAIREKLDNVLDDNPYSYEYLEFEELDSPEKHSIRAKTYREIFEEILRKGSGEQYNTNQFGILRHLLKKAAKYRIRGLLDLVLDNFDSLIPLIREMIVYIVKVINSTSVIEYQNKFREILESPFLDLPFINMWVFTLFQNPLFNEIEISRNYSKISRNRERAQIAKRFGDSTWIKEFKNGIDVVGNWDRRAIIYSSIILSEDELKHWLKLVSSKGDIIDKSLAVYILSMKKGADSER